MEDTNNILAKIDAVLRDEETPRWAIPILLCIRDDHIKLWEHLALHRRWSMPAAQILISVVTAIVIAGTLWILAGRLPGVFHP